MGLSGIHYTYRGRSYADKDLSSKRIFRAFFKYSISLWQYSALLWLFSFTNVAPILFLALSNRFACFSDFYRIFVPYLCQHLKVDKVTLNILSVLIVNNLCFKDRYASSKVRDSTQMQGLRRIVQGEDHWILVLFSKMLQNCLEKKQGRGTEDAEIGWGCEEDTEIQRHVKQSFHNIFLLVG